MSENITYRTQIIVAIIGVIGVLGGAFLANWDKIFSEKNPTPALNVTDQSHSVRNPTIVNVFYFPSRESDALRTKIALEKKEFIVNLYQAGTDLELAKDRPSYIKYKDINRMQEVKSLIENQLRQEFNVSESKKNWSRNAVLVILTDRSNYP